MPDKIHVDKRELITGLVETGCFKTGEFRIKSGKISPFYIDLRMTISDPALLELVCRAYASLALGLRYDRLAGIPLAAVPFAAGAALLLKKPLIIPRISDKDHGSGRRIEGAYREGETILLLDDLITTGLSKIEAVNLLRKEGLVVRDLLVLLERGRAGRADMEREGVSLHSFLDVGDLIGECLKMGIIDAALKERIEDFIRDN